MLQPDNPRTWPKPHVGPDWWDPSPSNIDVGTEHAVCSTHAYEVRISLQILIAHGTIVQVRCHVDDRESEEDSQLECIAIAQEIDQFLRHRPIAEALEFERTIFWPSSIVNQTIYSALLDWALKQPRRYAQLPTSPIRRRTEEHKHLSFGRAMLAHIIDFFRSNLIGL